MTIQVCEVVEPESEDGVAVDGGLEAASEAAPLNEVDDEMKEENLEVFLHAEFLDALGSQWVPCTDGAQKICVKKLCQINLHVFLHQQSDA